jgi:membrane-associated protein
MHDLIDFVLHFDKHLSAIIQSYGTLTYALLFAILFAETGLVVVPFLPGDSLLFAVGAVTARGDLNLATVFSLLLLAVFLGDNVNYWIGYFVGPKVFSRDDVRFLNKQHLERTREFFDKYGTKTVIYARFVPIVRTCTPFVAGIGRMPYARFLAYSVAGCLLWLSLCLFTGYFFGNIEAVKKNFSLVVLAIIAISLVPIAVEYVKHKKKA